jgi:hypothetical protein
MENTIQINRKFNEEVLMKLNEQNILTETGLTAVH